MKTFKVTLLRGYTVTIEAENEDNAWSYSEFFIGDCKDASIPREREELHFSFVDIEMTVNEAIDAELEC